VNDDTQVVAYDAHGGMFAARLWWMLRWVGHEAVAVLDGGLPAWQAHGLPMSTRAPGAARRARSRSRVAGDDGGRADDVLAQCGAGGAPWSTPARRTASAARTRPSTRSAAIFPGAKNRFFKDNLQADGRFKAPAQLKAELRAAVGDPPRAIMQCGSGVTACHNLLALEVAGMPGAACIRDRGANGVRGSARPEYGRSVTQIVGRGRKSASVNTTTDSTRMPST
jgi:thiosulfate/3-mercaptopyruvate sulfurtransferase